ncbi:D-Ala-D-Ala carboxypeptidase family metallohydrolase [Aureimonas sp. SK2]|uniref:YcbK family protein n=1 Tax=Aureimonas sp. SK2 TaxID=3015992 RepID=UPI0024447480|nr:D-Ala-D-Ala carboxypeptidase family metallohydrolase [Aureimonas sp. SK2]
MTLDLFSIRRAAARRGLLAATVISLPLALAGCVSAVDDTNAFGFAQAPEPSSVEDAIEQDAALAKAGKADGEGAETETAEASVADGKDTGSEAKAVAALPDAAVAARVAEADSAAKPGQASAQTALTGESAGGIKAGSFLTRASNPSVAAFAESKRPVEADHSLYASLYNQSQAKTPLRNAEAGKSGRVVVHQRSDETGTSDNALPGVDPKSLFEIGQRASVDSELMDDIGSSYQLASLSGIARLAPSGLMIQREDVVTNCFDSSLMNLIGQIERRFKQRVVITSGFRSPAHNRRVNGAKASMHMACKAADLHVPGVDGQEVARFVRALPGRGGVGTYCHTAAIHIDVGKMRDWNWPCRRRQST